MCGELIKILTRMNQKLCLNFKSIKADSDGHDERHLVNPSLHIAHELKIFYSELQINIDSPRGRLVDRSIFIWKRDFMLLIRFLVLQIAFKMFFDG